MDTFDELPRFVDTLNMSCGVIWLFWRYNAFVTLLLLQAVPQRHRVVVFGATPPPPPYRTLESSDDYEAI